MKYLEILVLIFFIGCSSPKQDLSIFGSFSKPSENPILKADSSFIFTCPVKNELVRWQKADVFNPAAIVKNDSVFLLYRCEDNPAKILGGRTSRIGIAVSADGINFTKYQEPVLYPDTNEYKEFDYPGGCEDPRIVETEDGTYVLAYTSWNLKIARISIAFSEDLFHWQKKGLAFTKANNGKFKDIWSKSASIVTTFKNNKQVAIKINGKYWMYWGENFINLAWSENLYDWYPLIDEKGELRKIVIPRPGKFDSQLTECGPPAIYTEQGIVLLYNGKNSTGDDADLTIPKGTYSVGMIVFDKNDMEKVISRSDSCLLKPTLPHEISGQYVAGTTFAEGLVLFKNQWFLYYGTADSFVGVAVAPNVLK